MSKKKVLLVAGALVAVGTVAALAAPHFRGHHRMGFHGGDGAGGVRFAARFAERLKSADVDKDGAITLQEYLGRPDAGFARLDKNGDGFIDAADLAARANESTEYRIKRFLKVLDANRDGKVTKEEFAQRAKDRFAMRDLNSDGEIGLDDLPPHARDRAQRKAERAKDGQERGKEPSKEGSEATEGKRFTLDRLLGRTDRRFARMDKNGDGVVDAKDIEATATERVAYGSRRFLKRFDANGDGRVSKDEFERFAKERFAVLDLDDDGKITESDLPPRMRGRGILK
jgi:Ca2+-binding EF-hand superfamily protein